MDIGYITDVGKKRANNEDSFSVDIDNLVFVVADGVGGQNAGEIASKIAVEEISRHLKKSSNYFEREIKRNFLHIYEGISNANKRIVEMSLLEKSYKDMATTVVVLVIHDGYAYISNIGDSRVYRIRDRNIEKLTEDHTVANQLIKEGKFTEDELMKLLQKRIPINVFSTITRALGSEEGVIPDDYSIPIKENDIFIMCTDGLYGEVSEETIKNIIINSDNSQSACNELVTTANANGGNDNITAIIIKIGADYHE